MADTSQNAEALFEKALEVAEKHLHAAATEAGPLGDYVVVAMIETAVNRAVDVAGHADIIDMLRDLASQIEADMDEEDDGDNDN